MRGRLFTDHDDGNAPNVAVINQTMAKHRFPSGEPVGARIGFNQGRTWSTVGIVGDVNKFGLDRPAGDEVYATRPAARSESRERPFAGVRGSVESVR